LVVYPFANLPHVCVDTYSAELQRGAFYIRTPDARSRVSDRASELHGMIQRALRNQRQILGRMLRGILYEDRQNTEPEAHDIFLQVLQESREHAQKYFGSTIFRNQAMFEGFFCLQETISDLSVGACRQLIEGLQAPSIQDFPWPHLNRLEYSMFAANTSIRSVATPKEGDSPCFYWEFHSNGAFYCAVRLPASENKIDASILLQLSSISVELMGQLFTNAGHGQKLLTLRIQLNNVMKRQLVSEKDSNNENYICQIPEIIVRKNRSAGDLEGGAAAGTAIQLFQEICERFNATLNESECRELVQMIQRKQQDGEIYIPHD